LERFAAVGAANRGRSAAEMVDAAFADVQRFSIGGLDRDDKVVMAIRAV